MGLKRRALCTQWVLTEGGQIYLARSRRPAGWPRFPLADCMAEKGPAVASGHQMAPLAILYWGAHLGGWQSRAELGGSAVQATLSQSLASSLAGPSGPDSWVAGQENGAGVLPGAPHHAWLEGSAGELRVSWGGPHNAAPASSQPSPPVCRALISTSGHVAHLEGQEP